MMFGEGRVLRQCRLQTEVGHLSEVLARMPWSSATYNQGLPNNLDVLIPQAHDRAR